MSKTEFEPKQPESKTIFDFNDDELRGWIQRLTEAHQDIAADDERIKQIQANVLTTILPWIDLGDYSLEAGMGVISRINELTGWQLSIPATTNSSKKYL